MKRRLRSPFCFLATGLAVILFVDFAEVGVGDVRINLRRVYGGVAEELLHTADVGTVT